MMPSIQILSRSSSSSRSAMMSSRSMVNHLMRRAMSTTTTGSSLNHQIWSERMSFATPESDFVQSDYTASPRTDYYQYLPVWSNTLSFASPESDFTGTMLPTLVTENAPVVTEQPSWMSELPIWSHALSFASPESDFTGQIPPNQHNNNNIDMALQLPHTLAEALQRQNDRLAIVVTTAMAPFRIVHVNDAWETLCEYQRCDVLHRTLGEIIQGSDSNKALANAMVQQVLKTHQPADAYLINYTAHGRRFTNHVTTGPLYLNEYDNKDDNVPFLVGILQEVDPSDVPLRLVTAA